MNFRARQCYLFVGVVVVVMLMTSDLTVGLGDVHTSAVTVAQLVQTEHVVIDILQDYITKEENRLEAIKRYVESWEEGEADYVHNPINSYLFLRRLTQEYHTVLDALHHTTTLDVRSNLTFLRESTDVPVEADVNGAAYALVKLQDTYNLTLDDLVEGDIMGRKAVHVLSASDCFRLAQQSFNNLEFELSEMWYEKGLELLHARQPLTQEELDKIDAITRQQATRSMMRNLVTKMARDSDDVVHSKFSGLGLPTSFQQQIYEGKDGVNQVKQVDELYRRLCRGEDILPPEAFFGLKCGYVFGVSSYHQLMPFKVELVWSDPIIIVYHDVLTHTEMAMVKHISTPRLATTMIHSFTTHEVRKSLARVGKTAWVRRGDDVTVDKVLARIEDMTGLTTQTSEDFHVLNYGIGGHYDAHVDFFDLQNKSLDKDPHQGDRLATMLFYLNDVEAGGSTVFPMLGIGVPARAGSALFWFNLKRSGKGDYRTVHAACPVLLGEKWIANLWIHEWGQEFRWTCTLDPEE